MPDRVPITTLPGLLTGHVAVDHLVLPAGVIGSASKLFVAVTDAPSGDDVTVELRTATGGGGDAISCTITDGTNSDSTSGALALTGTEALYLRISAEGGSAMNLSGWFELDGAAGIAVLTNLTLVKAHGNIDGSTYDSLLTTLIAGVSTAMQKYIGFPIVQTAYTAELVGAIGSQRVIFAPHVPVLASPAPVIRDYGTVVDSTTYTLLEDGGGFLAITDDVPGAWGAGNYRYSLDYSAGYSTVPSDLSLAATKQVRHEFRQAAEGGDRLGSLNKALESGGSLDWVPGGWLPEVREVMDLYRNVA